MIDELAKAIWATREARFPAYTRRKPDQLDEATGAFQNCREEALAVLRRLREPTEDVKNAGTYEREINEAHAGQIWRAMIDAAIGEKHE